MIEVNKTYKVYHNRKGKFTMHVTSFDSTWVKGTIVDGKAGAMLKYNEKEKGEEITVRISFCKFTEVEGDSNG